MNNLKVAIGDGFLEAFAQIPKAKQKKVMEFVAKFRHDPRASGINYETINDARDENFRSVRIDLEYRGIVLKPEQGNVYILLWVDKHDDAYQWARRHRCDIHPTTGVLQLMEVAKAEAEPAPAVASAPVPLPLSPLFEIPKDLLLRLGVPEIRMEWVQALTRIEALESGQSLLPVEVYEALYLLATGIPLDDLLKEYAPEVEKVVDTSDFATALERDASKRRFFVVENEMELVEMLEAPLEKWRVFLHPSQRRLVERMWNGPVRVLGGAGTGKTVVAMHRAKWLAQHVLAEGERILFTTFTSNLATDIEENLRKICPQTVMDRIEVRNLDAWVTRYLKSRNYKLRIVYPGGKGKDYDSCWERAKVVMPAQLGLPDSFYVEEWERVVLPQSVRSQKDYFLASRTGRGVALNRKQRAEIWPVFEEMRIQLAQKHFTTIEDAVYDAMAELEKDTLGSGRYRAIVVDEGQDFGPEMLQLLRRMVKPQENDLFIVGDGHQRIYRRKAVLGKCGIDVRGRSRKLKINYRTTEEIRNFATSVLEGIPMDDLDAGEDGSKDYRSLTHGEFPSAQHFESMKAELDWILGQVDDLVAEGLQPRDICITVRTNALLDEIQGQLGTRKVECRKLSRQQADNRNLEGIRLATMHRVKGLEFKAVFMACLNEGIMPLEGAHSHTKDPVEQNLQEASERALFHVAATRAVKHLFLSSHGRASRYLSSIREK
jgi:superfamily I DNA/RNA helicase